MLGDRLHLMMVVGGIAGSMTLPSCRWHSAYLDVRDMDAINPTPPLRIPLFRSLITREGTAISLTYNLACDLLSPVERGTRCLWGCRRRR